MTNHHDSIRRARAEQAAKEKQDSTIIFFGWLFAFLLAPVGIALGVWLCLRDRAGHGIAMILVALLIITSIITQT